MSNVIFRENLINSLYTQPGVIEHVNWGYAHSILFQDDIGVITHHVVPSPEQSWLDKRIDEIRIKL